MSDDQAAPSSSSEVVTSSIHRPWLIKMVIGVVVVIAFGLWGLYDATVAYPALGQASAEHAEWKFLQAAKKDGRIASASDITDPVAAFAEVSAKLPRTDIEQAKYDWLLALSRIGKLKPEFTKIDSPNSRLDELTTKWNGLAQPKPLEAYDMPLQWGIVVAGFGFGVWFLWNIATSSAKRYSWEPATSTLTLPGGRRVTPNDLADVDKRNWHKYFCALVFTDGSAPVDLDVLKYSGLEEWVLTMERIRFPERAEAEAAAEAEAEAAAAAATSDVGATAPVDDPTNAPPAP